MFKRKPSFESTIPFLSSTTTIQVNGKIGTIDARKLQNIRVLGRGKYGEVRLMKDCDSQLEFAVKLVPLMYGDSVDAERQFRELNVIKRTSLCPYCVMFYGAMLCEGEIYLLMEKMDESLDKLLIICNEKSKSFPEYLIQAIAFSVLKALDFMNELDIAHRDIKPSNILVNYKGEIKVCDFGISGILINSIMNSFTGDISYMAPERFNPNGGYFATSDLWSLGVTIVELVMGRCPYPKKADMFSQVQLLVEGPAPQLPSSYNELASDFVNQCLQKQKESRPHFANMLQHAWLRHFDESHVHAMCSQWITRLLLISPSNQT